MLSKLIILLVLLIAYAAIQYFVTQKIPSKQTSSSSTNSSSESAENTKNDDVIYIYNKRNEVKAKQTKIDSRKDQDALSGQFKDSVKNKLANITPEDKEKLKEIQTSLKSLHIKYDHNTQSALKYDNIKLD